MRNLIVVSSLALVAATSANAGGFAAPTVDVEPVVVAPVAEAPAWQGGYVGAALGYAFGGDDEIGSKLPGVPLVNLGKAELSGANLSLRAGYRWQRQNWVFGPELAYTGGKITDDFDYGTPSTNFESEVNNTIAVKFKTGYLVRPDTLVFGIAGWQRGDFTYHNGAVSTDYNANGYVVGLGAERMLNDRLSLTAEYEYSNFGKTDVDIGGGAISKATPEFSNVKLGLNFKF